MHQTRYVMRIKRRVKAVVLRIVVVFALFLGLWLSSLLGEAGRGSKQQSASTVQTSNSKQTESNAK